MIYPHILQLCYDNEAILVNEDEIKNISHPSEGNHEKYEGIDRISDPEFYVDSQVSISNLKIESCRPEDNDQ